MDSLSESMARNLCTVCCGICDKGIVIIKTQDTTELCCPDYKPNREMIKKSAYRDNKVNIVVHKSKALMDLNI